MVPGKDTLLRTYMLTDTNYLFLLVAECSEQIF